MKQDCAKYRHRNGQRLPVWLKLPIMLVLFFATSLFGAKLSRDLDGIAPGSRVNVIVQFTAPPAELEFSAIARLGGVLKHRLPNIHGALFSLPAAALPALAANPRIYYASPDRRLSGSLEFAEPTTGANIAFQYGWTGTGIGVAIIDSGVSAGHPDLRPRVTYSENFVSYEDTSTDVYGHGTHVAGIVGGNGSSSTGANFIYTFKGIAPSANLVNLRVLDKDGQGTDSDVIRALDRAVALKDVYGIRVVNISLGRVIQESHTLDPLCQAVARAWAAGLVVVVAAGNNGRDNSMSTSGYGTITSPGNSPYAITVAAMKDMGSISRADDLIASYSSKGPTLLDQVVKPDLVAPGSNIASAYTGGSTLSVLYPGNVVPVTYYKLNGGANQTSSYMRLSGTSMAAPMVSGAAALLLQQQPALTPDQVKARLMRTATKTFPATSIVTDPATGATYTSTYDLFTIGAGYLDVWAALSDRTPVNGSATSPAAVYDSTAGVTRVVFSPGSTWLDGTLWGTTVVWGTNVIVDSTCVVWGTAVVWGSSTSEGFVVVWGTTVVWGTSQPFPEAVSASGDK